MRYEASPYEFDEELDCAVHDAWFIDGLHVPDRPDYTAISWVADVVTHGFCWAAEKLSLPSCQGIIWRDYKQLRFIITPIVIGSEEEVKEREEKFKTNILGLIKDFSTKWDQYKNELLELYKPFKTFDLQNASSIELIRKLKQIRDVGMRMCEIHFWGMYVSFSFFMMFRELWKSLGFDPNSKEFSAVLRGFDNKSFECERELFKLSQNSLNSNIQSIFKLDSPAVVPELEKSEEGQQWLKDLNTFIDEYGWRCEKCWFPSSPSWQDDPKYVIKKIQEYMKLGDKPAIHNLSSEERDATIEKIIAKVPKEKAGIFKLLLKGAQYADAFSEEHDLYCEMQTDALRRMFLLEFGKRFFQAGVIDDVEDIFYLGYEETEKMAYWPEKWRLQSLISNRKAKAKADLEKGIKPIISKNMNDEEAFGYMMKSRDPILIQVIVGELPQPKPELKADIIGVAGSPGEVEGIARVVISDEELDSVLPGEILVCPTTSISWTTTFALVKGVVVDRGGLLSHAAVVSREYGLPCVLNTFVGTSQIKTGQRVKVDGTNGAVYLLS